MTQVVYKVVPVLLSGRLLQAYAIVSGEKGSYIEHSRYVPENVSQAAFERAKREALAKRNELNEGAA